MVKYQFRKVKNYRRTMVAKKQPLVQEKEIENVEKFKSINNNKQLGLFSTRKKNVKTSEYENIH